MHQEAGRVCLIIGEMGRDLVIHDWDWEDIWALALQIANDWTNEVGIENNQERGYIAPYAQRILSELYYSRDDDAVNPSHYQQGKIQCIDAIESATTNLQGIEAFCTGNAIKYLWRWREKNGVQDLRKAQWYIDKLEKRSSADVLS